MIAAVTPSSAAVQPDRIYPAQLAPGGAIPTSAVSGVAWDRKRLPPWVSGVGSALLLVRLVWHCLRVVRLRREAWPCGDVRAVEFFAAAGLRRPRLLESDRVATPIAVGFGPPAVVLPAGFAASVGEEVLRDVFAHEAAHLRRRDGRVVLLQQVAAALFWPVVTVHLLNRALRRAREDVCDIAALAAVGGGRSAVAYGQTLLRMAERATAGRRVAASVGVAPRRGELERRVAGLLDPRRSRAVRAGRGPRLAATAVLIGAGLLVGGTRFGPATAAAGNDDPPAVQSVFEPPEAPMEPIAWTEVPTVAPDDPALHRGVVFGPDGQPLAGAKVYAGGSMDLLDGDRPGGGGGGGGATAELGLVRAVTDALGRFQFTAPDLTYPDAAYRRLREETLLVATKDGSAPAWLKTWGDDRTLRSHWHPGKNRPVELHLTAPAPLSGRFLGPDGAPLEGTRVERLSIMVPKNRDLDTHVAEEERTPIFGFSSGPDYQESTWRPGLLPAVPLAATTDADGRFTLDGLPKDRIVRSQVRHPAVETTDLRVAAREMEPVFREPRPAGGEPAVTLQGSGFTRRLPAGVTLTGQVTTWIQEREPAAGMKVALANHNTADGTMGETALTDAEGRFTLTGLAGDPGGEGYELAFVGSFGAPFQSQRQTVRPGFDARVEVLPAVPYRLTLTDPRGEPVDRTVYSIQVQATPGSVRSDVKSRFNDPVRVAPGVYEGIVPTGPGAVVALRGYKSGRPVAVDPKASFAPGRTDRTPEERRFAYGNAWWIARPGVSTTERLAVQGYNWLNQLDLAAVAFTDARPQDGPLQLAATVYRDDPPEVTLVDEAGAPVAGASLRRQLDRYDGDLATVTFPLPGLHPDRAEFFTFTHEKRGLIGVLSTTLTDGPLRVVMRPAATIRGRMVKADGEPSDDFGILVRGGGVPPDMFVAGPFWRPSGAGDDWRGRFALPVAPGFEYAGAFVRRTGDWRTRPTVGAAFGPVTPAAGQTVDLGEVIVP